jgi:hypothetical protein
MLFQDKKKKKKLAITTLLTNGFYIFTFLLPRPPKSEKKSIFLCTQQAHQVVILKYFKKFGHSCKNERNTATLSLEVKKVSYIGAGKKLFFSVKKKFNFFF